jgi:hypothetical protein
MRNNACVRPNEVKLTALIFVKEGVSYNPWVPANDVCSFSYPEIIYLRGVNIAVVEEVLICLPHSI